MSHHDPTGGSDLYAPRWRPGTEANGVAVTNTLPTRETILAQLGGFPEELRRLVLAESSQEDLIRPASDGGWGVVEILAHLRDWEEIHLERAHLIAEEDQPHLPSYDDALWAIERDYRAQDPCETFDQFADLRQQLVEFLSNLPSETWQRTGEHSAFGIVTLQWLANHISEHDQEHLQQALDALT
jgi:hypothetical protein